MQNEVFCQSSSSAHHIFMVFLTKTFEIRLYTGCKEELPDRENLRNCYFQLTMAAATGAWLELALRRKSLPSIPA